MHFTLKQLKYIEATGRLGSIANAATELHISQSSITAAIGAFERQIGMTCLCAHRPRASALHRPVQTPSD